MGRFRRYRMRPLGVGFVAALISCCVPRASGAYLPPVIEVGITTEHHVGPVHSDKNRMFRALKLEFLIPPASEGGSVAFCLHPGVIRAGAGLVVEHIAEDGTRTKQEMPVEDWWFSQSEIVEIRSKSFPLCLDSEVSAGQYLDFSKVGVYRISYVHPWVAQEKGPTTPVFLSKTLTIACVAQERSDQLQAMLAQKPQLALASYQFKNPPASVERGDYWRSGPLETIDKAIGEGMKRDEVLLLLGSPDRIHYSPANEQGPFGGDESWYYDTSPVGGYCVTFRGASVIGKSRYADQS